MTASKIDKVSFFRKGKFYYFKVKENVYTLNYENMNNLKMHLSFPTNLRFYGLNRAQIGRVIADLIDSRKCSVRIERITNSKVKQHEAFLLQS